MDVVLSHDMLTYVAQHVIGERHADLGCFRDMVAFAQTSRAMCSAAREALRPYAHKKHIIWAARYRLDYRPIQGFAFLFEAAFSKPVRCPRTLAYTRIHGDYTTMQYGPMFAKGVVDAAEDMASFVHELVPAAERRPDDARERARILLFFGPSTLPLAIDWGSRAEN